MNHILTLICNPCTADLDGGIVAETAAALRQQGAETGDADWLADGVACDLPFSGIDPQQAEAIASLHLQGFAVDINALENQNRRKKLLIADMDSTIVTGETLDDLAEFAGCGEKVAHITNRAMNGEIRFVDALKERIRLLEGLPVENLERTMNAVELTPGAETLVRTMKANGAKSMLVSGGFTFFTKRVRDWVGFDADRGNLLEIENDKLTGGVIEPIINKAAKLDTLNAFAANHGVTLEDTLAVGDGANDLPMLKAAGLGVAYHAKPVLIESARVGIEHGDLTALLYLQGYRAKEFISS